MPGDAPGEMSTEPHPGSGGTDTTAQDGMPRARTPVRRRGQSLAQGKVMVTARLAAPLSPQAMTVLRKTLGKVQWQRALRVLSVRQQKLVLRGEQEQAESPV